MKCKWFALWVGLVTMLAASHGYAVTLPSIFSDQMVLQREADVPLWGDAKPLAKITIRFADQLIITAADDQGRWRTNLDPLSASSQSRSLLVTSDQDEPKAEFTDVLVGDVWVGSGQSNMAGKVSSYAKNDETLAAIADKPIHENIRLMTGGPKPTWGPATAANVAQFSALLFSFGDRLNRDLDVPIGLIVGAVGGTPSGSWIPPQTYASSPLCRNAVAEFSKTYDEQSAKQQYEAMLARWEKVAAQAKADRTKPRGKKPPPPVGPGQPNRGGKIGGLYERYIQPVVGYRIRGVLWDQGEARSGVVGVDQFTMMTELIRGWREAWGQGDFPFLFVQKPSGGGCALSNDDPITRNADPFTPLPAVIPREASSERGTIDRWMYVQLMHNNDNAWMVPASDLGSGIHPTNKWGYGNRAAEVALSKVYKRDVQAYGPIYKSQVIEGNQVVLSFDELGKGLISAHSDQLQGFAIAGEDQQWQWGSARIDGDKVVVWSAAVAKPKRVRYAFAAKRAWANLFNKDGLPALAFESGD